MITRHLVTGDPMNPEATDLIVETGALQVGSPVPEGWRVLSGNMQWSSIARVVMRFEIED